MKRIDDKARLGFAKMILLVEAAIGVRARESRKKRVGARSDSDAFFNVVKFSSLSTRFARRRLTPALTPTSKLRFMPGPGRPSPTTPGRSAWRPRRTLMIVTMINVLCTWDAWTLPSSTLAT